MLIIQMDRNIIIIKMIINHKHMKLEVRYHRNKKVNYQK